MSEVDGDDSQAVTTPRRHPRCGPCRSCCISLRTHPKGGTMDDKTSISRISAPHEGIPQKQQPGTGGMSRFFSGALLARLAGFGVVIFIGWTLLSMVMPPGLTRGSKRAA